MCCAVGLMSLFLATSAPEDLVTVSARIEADELEVGRNHDIVVDIAFKEGFSGSAGGIPGAILQIDVPPSARLTGRVLKTRKEQSRNEYLQEPFERLIKETPAYVEFTLRRPPAKKERFGISVLAYVGTDGGEDAWFVRRRSALPLLPNAKGEVVAPTDSQWGEEDVLQIGDKAEAFTLPTADGLTVSLDQYVGKKNVIVTTYRAYW